MFLITDSLEARMAQMPHDFWNSLNKHDLRQFSAAVFFLFATIGPLSLLMDEAIIQASWKMLIVMTFACGLFSLSIVLSARKPFRLIMTVVLYAGLIISISVVKPVFLSPDVPAATVAADIPFTLSQEQLSDIAVKRSVFGVTAIVCIAVGYGLFVRSLGKENLRRAEMEAEVRIAQAIHESLLPQGALSLSWCDAAGKSIPASQVGGDFYDLLRISNDRILAVVADASGHGTGAGILSAMTKSGIIQELKHTTSPAELLRQVNSTIYSVTKKNMFVTCAVALFDRTAMTVTMATAGHPPILRYDPVSDTVEQFRNHNLALGIGPDPQFHMSVVPIRSGEVVCLITDGLTEASNRQQEQFGMERTSAALRCLPAGSAADASASLIGTVMEFAGPGPLADDITALVIRIH